MKKKNDFIMKMLLKIPIAPKMCKEMNGEEKQPAKKMNKTNSAPVVLCISISFQWMNHRSQNAKWISPNNTKKCIGSTVATEIVKQVRDEKKRVRASVLDTWTMCFSSFTVRKFVFAFWTFFNLKWHWRMV